MPQVPLAEHNNMVETFPADGADQALRIAVLPGRTRCYRMIANAEGPNPSPVGDAYRVSKEASDACLASAKSALGHTELAPVSLDTTLSDGTGKEWPLMKDPLLESSAAFVGPVGSGGGGSPSTLSIGQAVPPGGLAPGQRWSVGRKREVVLRLLRGEAIAVSEELAAAMKRIGELTMENEVLRVRVGHVGPLARRRSR